MSNARTFLCPQCHGNIVQYTAICPHCVFDLSGFDYSKAAPAPQYVDHAEMTNAVLPPSNIFADNIGAVIATIVVCLILGGLGMAAIVSWSSNSAVNNSANKTYNTAAGNTSVPYNRSNPPPSAKNTTTSGSVVGRTGRLITDVNVRRESSKYADIIGTHFMNARVQILAIESYPLDNEISIWYRVKVIEYGCSADSSLGCGKKSSYDSDEGWMNAKNITIE